GRVIAATVPASRRLLPQPRPRRRRRRRSTLRSRPLATSASMPASIDGCHFTSPFLITYAPIGHDTNPKPPPAPTRWPCSSAGIIGCGGGAPPPPPPPPTTNDTGTRVTPSFSTTGP